MHVYENCLKYQDTKEGRLEFRKSLEAYFKFTQSTHVLQYIAENNNKEPEKWFDLLLVDKKKIISRNKLIDLEGNLQRMVESYQNNTGINLLNAITRILLGKTLDNVLKSQLEKAIQEIRNFNDTDYDYIGDNIHYLNTIADQRSKRGLWDILYGMCKSPEQEKSMAIELGDIKKLLPSFNERLNVVVKEFANGIG
ncbi:hypothetical protein HUU62_27215 [Rhodoferax sp. 4810]|nr:hypothetical protein [Rhodoferax jenense]